MMTVSDAFAAARSLIETTLGGREQESDAARKAEIICRFAQETSDELSQLLGAPPGEESNYPFVATDWNNNSFSDETLRGEGIRSLSLCRLPEAFVPDPEGMEYLSYERKEYELVFCRTRVLRDVVTWRLEGPEGRSLVAMSYEEAARFVVLYMAEQILRGIRLAPPDAKGLLLLFGRLEALLAPSP